MTPPADSVLDFAGLDATPVSADPFPHLLLRNFVRPDRLADVVASLPPLGSRGSFPVESVRLGPPAAQLMREMQGTALRAAIAAKFGLDLSDAPVMVTLRGQTGERDGQIHCDSAAKRVTVLLYLNPASAAWARQEGCLRLLRGPNDLEDYVVEVPPVDGTLLVFPNGPTTWHGHRQFVGRRYTVQLNYMTTDAKAKYEMRRHRVSAIVKRLLPAA
ncbi:2OG-Fe(II) oxygenase [Acidiphilium sp. AL]|uniref:2OG-Fe(II) oxygenase n=1 Tax=Acidiphilium iwatense TaxID=768198 RepID=A0ABS9DSJ2_9PROT|nr:MULTISPECIES: 2OG-Fe(II) oxygenase [Acidiphilium]MCF3945703.1 2OG-Fe(II) oxygenase [Acidiphilium iwatense]MCU4159283.1 2OG-Fe(II) oxygenase [Acidiphilium sp. AL]